MFFIFSLSFLVANIAVAQSSSLNGTWIPAKQEMGGNVLPASVFANQQLVINDSNYTFTAESVDKGVVETRDSLLDVYGKEGVNAGKHLTAVYKLENDQLTICYNLKGDSYPNTFETKNQPMFFLSVFKRKE